MAFQLLNTYILLEYATLNARRKTFVKDPDSPFENDGTYVYTPFTVPNSSVQPIKSDSQLVLEEGLREYEKYELYTTTALKSAREASQDLADQVEVNGLFGLEYFTVVMCDKFSITSSGPQYKAIIVKYPKNE